MTDPAMSFSAPFKQLARFLSSTTVAQLPILTNAVAPKLVFDDEPIESVLYGDPGPAPTAADLFAPARELALRLSNQSQNSDNALAAIVRFLVENHEVTDLLFRSLAALASTHIPRFPQLPDPAKLAAIEPLVRRLWERACEESREDWQLAAGAPLWELYEASGRYAEARTVLAEMIAILKRKGDPGESSLINNQAYQFACEARWREAAALFDHAARLGQQRNNQNDYTNARNNYWACRFECEGLTEENAVAMEEEFRRLLGLFREKSWESPMRKSLVYLARIYAARNDLNEAVGLVREAVEIDKHLESRYLESDEQLLAQLIKQNS